MHQSIHIFKTSPLPCASTPDTQAPRGSLGLSHVAFCSFFVHFFLQVGRTSRGMLTHVPKRVLARGRGWGVHRIFCLLFLIEPVTVPRAVHPHAAHGSPSRPLTRHAHGLRVSTPPAQAIGAKLVRQASQRTNDQAGDSQRLP